MYRNTLTTITAVFALTINLVFSQVVINEIMYNPPGYQGSDYDYEFMELHNPGATAIDMSGFSFTQGVNHVFAGVDNNGDGDYTDAGVDNNGDGDFDDAGVDNDGDGLFDGAGTDVNGNGDYTDAGDVAPDTLADVLPDEGPGTFLPAGGYMIVCVPTLTSAGNVNGDVTNNVFDPDGDGVHTSGAIVVEWTSGGLSNGGEDIEIVDTSGDVVDFVDYEDGTNGYGNWGNAHDGGGGSLELVDATAPNDSASAWQTSWIPSGTPGYENSNDKAIKNINLDIKGGTIAAFVGHSGAGKSTIINLLPRFYDPQNGKIYIDEQNTKSVNLNSVRKSISLVSQDVILFDSSVKENILYANQNASEDEFLESCKFAAAEEFIRELPQKYDTLIGENGIRLSGGQKQRLSIARAILKKSPIILLDEATSSLDAESEEVVQNAIKNLTKNKTTLVIAHRLSTIHNADKIFVIKKGSLIDSGKHEELIKNCDYYKLLYEKQLK